MTEHAPQDWLDGRAAEEQAPSTGAATPHPVGHGAYLADKADCLYSIALRSGHRWQTIWNDPANEELRRVREDEAVLLGGDRLTIPPLRPKCAPCATDQRHRFRALNRLVQLELTVRIDGKAQRSEPYSLT